MKSIFLLLLESYTSSFSFAQTYADFLGEATVLEWSEKVATWTQQTGLQSNTGLVIDSMQTAEWLPINQSWRPQQRKYFYYLDGFTLGKTLILNLLSDENSWHPKQIATYSHQESGTLSQYNIENYKEGVWQPFQQVHLLYNPDQILRKEQYLLWDDNIQDWQEDEVTDLSYYSDGKLLGIKTAELHDVSQNWGLKDYRTFVYKSEEGWLDEEQLLRWDADLQRMTNEYRLVARYSGDILKEVVHFVWNEGNHEWESIGKMVLFYGNNWSLERISFQGIGDLENTWEEVAQCEFAWAEALISGQQPVEQNAIQVYLANPYRLGDYIQWTGLNEDKTYQLVLYNLAGQVQDRRNIRTRPVKHRIIKIDLA